MPNPEHEPDARAVDDELVEPLGTPSRPSWRGRLHLMALVLAAPVVAVLAVSTTYHRWVHTPRARSAWRRADHATIYLMIAGTCTAIALAALDTGWTVALLVPIWAVAVVGAMAKAFRFDRTHRLGGALYIALGWSGLLLVVPVWRHGGALPVGLLFGGGVVYTVGAYGFSHRWPTLSSRRFSYHEVWHACTIVAAGLHFTAIARLTI